MIERVCILGSSSGRNAGDAALVAGIMDSVDAACGRRVKYDIPTIKPDFVRKTYPNDVRPVSMLPWSLSLKMFGLPTFLSVIRSDLSIIFDAVLFDRNLYNPLFNHMISIRWLLRAAKRRGKHIGCYNVGIGPINTAAGAKVLKDICDLTDFITVRDDESLAVLKKIGVDTSHTIVTADAALSVQCPSRERSQQILSELGMPIAKDILAINVNAYLATWSESSRKSMSAEEFAQIYGDALTKVLDQIQVPLLFVGTQYHDVDISNLVASKVKTNQPIALLSNREYSPYEIKGVLSQVSLLCGMRLHSVILASGGLTPVIGINYQSKVRHYLKRLGLEGYCLNFDDFNVDNLTAFILQGWQNRSAIRSQLTGKIPELIRESFKAAKIISGISDGLDINEVLGKLRQNPSAVNY